MKEDIRVRAALPEDGHTYITRSERLNVKGGDEETHQRMTEVAVRYVEGLEKSGKRSQDCDLPEVLDRFHEAIEKTR